MSLDSLPVAFFFSFSQRRLSDEIAENRTQSLHSARPLKVRSRTHSSHIDAGQRWNTCIRCNVESGLVSVPYVVVRFVYDRIRMNWMRKASITLQEYIHVRWWRYRVGRYQSRVLGRRRVGVLEAKVTAKVRLYPSSCLGSATGIAVYIKERWK